MGSILDAFRAVHDPIGAWAIAVHITLIHRLTDEAEARVADAASRAAPFRVRLAEAILLDATPPARGVAPESPTPRAGSPACAIGSRRP